MAFRKFICIAATVIAVGTMLVFSGEAQAQRNGFRIGNAVQFGGGQGFRLGRIQFGGGQAVRIGGGQQYYQPQAQYVQPQVQYYRPAQQFTQRQFVQPQQQFVQPQQQFVQQQFIQPQQFVQPQQFQQQYYAPAVVQAQFAQQPGVAQNVVVAGQFDTQQPQSVIQPTAASSSIVEAPGAEPLPGDAPATAPVAPPADATAAVEPTEMEKPMAKTPMESTETVRPWDPSQGIENDDEVIRVIEPSNDGMIRFKYPKSANGKLTYKLDGNEYQLDPGQTLALPASEKFAFSYTPVDGADEVTPNITEQGTYVFVENNGSWNFEKYVAPGSVVETDEPSTEQPEGN